MKFMGIHSKMARAALGLGVRELAEMAKVSPDTIARLERGEELKERTLEAVQLALESAGVEFTNGGNPGVRMRDFRIGDKVKYRLGKAGQGLEHAIGEIIEIEPYPIRMGPVPRVRARIWGVETAWHMPSDFEFATYLEDGIQRQIGQPKTR